MNDLLPAGDGRPIVLYMKIVLSSLASQILAASLPMLWTTFRYISQEKATGSPRLPGIVRKPVFRVVPDSVLIIHCDLFYDWPSQK
jgi:hypothetical protein